MCLNCVVDEQLPESIIGYVVMIQESECYTRLFWHNSLPIEVRVGERIEAQEVPILLNRRVGDDREYTSGFHVFENLEDAQAFMIPRSDEVIVKCKLEEIHTVGWQHIDGGLGRPAKVYVGRIRTILEEVK